MDKDLIRIIIFAIGLLVIIGMTGWHYLRHKRLQQDEMDNGELSELEHSELGHNESDYETEVDYFDDENNVAHAETEETLEAQTDTSPSVMTQEADTEVLLAPVLKKPSIIQFSLISSQEEGFNGTEIFEVLDDVGLEYGNLQIFERLDARRLVDFGVANMVKPGIIPSTNLAAFHCPGLVFFMQPGKLDNPVAVFDDFVRTFQYVADQLGGEMRDHHREPLTEETIAQLRQSLLTA